MTITRTRRTGIAVGAAAAIAGLGLIASALPAQAMGTGNPYEDGQVGVTYTVYEPTFTAGLAMPKQGDGGVCPKGQDEYLVVPYGPKATPSFVVYEGNPICADPGDGQQVGAVKVNGATARLFANCDEDSSCMRQDVKKLGGYLQVTLPAGKGLRPVNIQIVTDGQNAISAKKLIRIARSLQPVQ